jgi:hypothetical protein
MPEEVIPKLMTRDQLKQFIKDELNAGIVNLELSDSIIERNIDRALMLSSDYFNYTKFVGVDVNKGSGSSGSVELSTLTEDNTIPMVVAVYPSRNILNIDAALLGLGSVFISTMAALNPQLNAYATMINKLSQLESILGRNAKVIGDKLYLDHYFGESVTVEFIPQTVRVEDIHEGAWIRFLIEYTAALCKKHMAQARGKYVVSSNPATTNSAELLDQANAELDRLDEELKTKGVLLASR